MFEVLSNLAQRHEVHLVTRVEEDELHLLDAVRPLCKEVHFYIYRTAAIRRLPDTLRLILNYFGFSRYADRIIRKGDYDIVQVEWVETALLIRKGKAPMVLDAHDVITKPAEREARRSGGAVRLLARLKYILVKAAERRIMLRFNTIFTLSEFDRDYLLRMAPGLKVQTVPVPAGLDITERPYVPMRNTILFLGSYKHRKVNVEAALFFYHKVFPLVRKKIPDVRFVIAGYGPPEELTSLAERDSHVIVPGFVEDIDRCYKEAEVFVAPILTGGGIIVKILDALSAGVPVVTTPYGNEGIGAVPGRDLMVADGPEGFASAVEKLLADREFAAQMARRGREFVRDNYSLESVMSRIERAYEDLAGGPKRERV